MRESKRECERRLDPFEASPVSLKRVNLYECHEKSFKSLRGSIRKGNYVSGKKGHFPPSDLQKGHNPCITFSRARLKLGFEIISGLLPGVRSWLLETNTLIKNSFQEDFILSHAYRSNLHIICPQI